MQTWVRYLIKSLLALVITAALPAAAQDFSSGVPEATPYRYFSLSLSDAANYALKSRNFKLASKLSALLNAFSGERDLVIDLAAVQVRAGDYTGSDQTIAMPTDPYSRAKAFTNTGTILAEQNRPFEARAHFVSAFHEVINYHQDVKESELSGKRYLFDLLIRAEIRAGYRSMARITMSHFETELRQAHLLYPPDAGQFSEWNAEDGDIDEALRWYRLGSHIPPRPGPPYGFVSDYPSSIPARTAIILAYVRAGNADAAWNLCDTITNDYEKLDALWRLSETAIQSGAVPDLSNLLLRVAHSADALPWEYKRSLMTSLLSFLERARSPLLKRFTDLLLRPLDAKSEVEIRIDMAKGAVQARRRGQAEAWIKPLPQLLLHVSDRSLRLGFLQSYALLLHALRHISSAKRILNEVGREEAQKPSPREWLSGMSYLAQNQREIGDAAGELDTDLAILHEAQTVLVEAQTALVTLRELTESLLRLNRKSEARDALELLKRVNIAEETRIGRNTGYTASIDRFEATIAGTLPPSPEFRPILLSEALRISDDTKKAEELNRYIGHLLFKHRLKQALQVLPLFPMAEDHRMRVKQALRLK